jgi:type I restriction enzyme R subunit
MSEVGQRERLTQQQMLRFFQDHLGYRFLGDWKGRAGNRNVEEGLLRDWLTRQGHGERVIKRALRELDQAAAISGSKTLYDANRAVYEKLRYGVHVKPSVQEQTVTVWLIDWENPENNGFAVAEEVTVVGPNAKRPDVVLYVNGIALGVLELKRSTVAVAKGIR